MPYRSAAERPDHDPLRDVPVERHEVARYSRATGTAMFVGALALSAGMVAAEPFMGGLAGTGVMLASVAVVLALRAVVWPVWVEVDAHGGVVRTRAQHYPIDEGTTAEVEAIDDSAFHVLLLLGPGERRVRLAEGREADVARAADAIERAVALRFNSPRSGAPTHRAPPPRDAGP